MRFSDVLGRVPRLLRNFYLLTGLAFLVWMLLFDSNDLLKQYEMLDKYRELQEQKQYYTGKIEEVKQDRAELLSSPEMLEKFAREKYVMKRPGEDVFLLVPEEKE
ncbi:MULTISPECIES: FtsB family cell division protein [Hymenobacter]|uniref:Septum formation initiator family protein n=2 Tax=Hymenobacter TaxID=89966 RepID=A0A328BLH5_9BACT|nr:MULTISPECIES: septum formation initiator family protein [Hymenobacter]RAK66794.1 septum formation initiator family protein [Hymenobacter edaphi]TLM90494.1 septum formation initiator family protein [Hymenobacter jeollabukensis]